MKIIPENRWLALRLGSLTLLLVGAIYVAFNFTFLTELLFKKIDNYPAMKKYEPPPLKIVVEDTRAEPDDVSIPQCSDEIVKQLQPDFYAPIEMCIDLEDGGHLIFGPFDRYKAKKLSSPITLSPEGNVEKNTTSTPTVEQIPAKSIPFSYGNLTFSIKGNIAPSSSEDIPEGCIVLSSIDGNIQEEDRQICGFDFHHRFFGLWVFSDSSFLIGVRYESDSDPWSLYLDKYNKDGKELYKNAREVGRSLVEKIIVFEDQSLAVIKDWQIFDIENNQYFEIYNSSGNLDKKFHEGLDLSLVSPIENIVKHKDGSISLYCTAFQGGIRIARWAKVNKSLELDSRFLANPEMNNPGSAIRYKGWRDEINTCGMNQFIFHGKQNGIECHITCDDYWNFALKVLLSRNNGDVLEISDID